MEQVAIVTASAEHAKNGHGPVIVQRVGDDATLLMMQEAEIGVGGMAPRSASWKMGQVQAGLDHAVDIAVRCCGSPAALKYRCMLTMSRSASGVNTTQNMSAA
nr:hypothetical protein [Achromobacter xylosoxidans]